MSQGLVQGGGFVCNCSVLESAQPQAFALQYVCASVHIGTDFLEEDHCSVTVPSNSPLLKARFSEPDLEKWQQWPGGVSDLWALGGGGRVYIFTRMNESVQPKLFISLSQALELLNQLGNHLCPKLD